MDVKFLIAGDRAVSVEFGSVISLEVNAKVRALDEKLKESVIPNWWKNWKRELRTCMKFPQQRRR